MSGKNNLFRAHCQQVPKIHYSSAEHQRPHCKQDKHSSLSCFTLFEALVILLLLQETHCINAGKLVLPGFQLAESFLSRKHGLATFVHERLRYTFLDQSPPTLEIEWLCVDVDGYEIVNVYKSPQTRLQSLDLPEFPHPCFFAGNFNCHHVGWGYDDNSLDGECLAGWEALIVLPFNTMPRMPPAFTLAARTMAPIQI